MFAASAFGTFHSLVAFAAVLAGLLGLASEGRISADSLSGKIYTATALAACVTGLILFHSSGVSVLVGLFTLAAFAFAAVATRANLFGGASKHVATLSYMATFVLSLATGVA
jgi:hypothetical protein